MNQSLACLLNLIQIYRYRVQKNSDWQVSRRYFQEAFTFAAMDGGNTGNTGAIAMCTLNGIYP